MSTYNTLTSELQCPHCGTVVVVRIDFRFGLRDQLEYRLGDRLIWEGRGTRTPSQRPVDGCFQGEGYTECPQCGNAFWTQVNVQSDILVDATVDWDREEYPYAPPC